MLISRPEEGMYLGQVEWTGNSDEVLIEKFSRFSDHRDFLLVTVTGMVKTIYSETNDGWRHARRYSRDGKELALLTSGDQDVIDRAIIDEERGWYYFYASPDAKWAIHAYSTLDLPPVHELIEIETHRVVSLLEDNHVIRDGMKSISCQPAEFLKLDIGDGILRYLLENLQLDLCNDELLV